MSTNGVFQVYKAIVHSIVDDVAYVRIPALLGGSIVPVQPVDINSEFASPDVGVACFVAVSDDRSQVSFL